MTVKTHILINAFSAKRGGGQTYLINLLKRFKDNESMKVTLMISKDTTLKIENPNIEKIVINFPVNNPYLRSFWERFFLPSILKKEKVDILFCPGGVVGTKAPAGCKTVTMFRNMIPFDLIQRKKYPIGLDRLRNYILNKVMLNSMEQADLVIFISNFAKKVIEGISNKGIKKAEVIPHGISDDFRLTGEDSRPVGLPESEYIVYASTVDVYKSQLEIAEAYKILKNKNVNRLPILLVGAEVKGRYSNSVNDKIKEYELEKEVLLVGSFPYSEMPLVYKNASFILFASQSENCPNILLESMASGKAVLCSDMQPMPEFGEAAVKYFDPRSPNDLANKLEEMFTNQNIILELEKLSNNQSLKYNWDKSANKTWEVLRSLS